MPAKKKSAPKTKKAHAKKPAKPHKHKKVAPHADVASAQQSTSSTPPAAVTPGSIGTPLPAAASPIGAALPSSTTPAPLGASLPSANPAASIGAALPSAAPPPPVVPLGTSLPSAAAPLGSPLPSPAPLGASLPAATPSFGSPLPSFTPTPKPAAPTIVEKPRGPNLLQRILHGIFRSRIARIGFPLVVVVGGFFLLRSLPCSIHGDYSTWQVWGRLAPNLVCSLDVSNNATKITTASLDKRIGTFKNLTALHLANNKLETISPTVFTLPKLETLILDGNRLVAVPTDIDKLWKLSTLSLKNNALRELPPNLMNMQSVVQLDLSANRLRNVPKSMTSMKNLRSLNISQNAFSGITLEVRSLTQLTELVAGATSLTATSQKKVQTLMPGTTIYWNNDAMLSSGPKWYSGFRLSGSGAALSTPGVVPARPKAVTGTLLSIPIAPPATKATKAKKAATPSAPAGTPPTCPNILDMNSYSFCIPEKWTTVIDLTNKTTELVDASGTTVATMSCPLKPGEFKNWAISTSARSYVRDGKTYTADLWIGSAVDGASDDLLILFVHLNDLAHWYGDGSADAKESCMIVSTQPLYDQEIFRTILASIY